MPSPKREQRPPPEAAPLVHGDCLNAKEFLLRCEARPGLKKVELIQGLVCASVSASARRQASGPDLIQVWLEAYTKTTVGTSMAASPWVLLDRENVVRPDYVLRMDQQLGGRSHLNSKRYIVGSPELVIDLSFERGINDLKDKLAMYHRSGVQEYLVWRRRESKLEWYQWEQAIFHLMPPEPNSVFRSKTFPGLWLNLSALFISNASGLLNTLRSGLQSTGHAAFVARLAKRRGATPGQTA